MSHIGTFTFKIGNINLNQLKIIILIEKNQSNIKLNVDWAFTTTKYSSSTLLFLEDGIRNGMLRAVTLQD
jgi:hypothetical protein